MNELPFLLLCFCFFLLGIKVHKDWVDTKEKHKKEGKE